jgi:excinuclease UvrABC nuclease subunit
VRRKAPPHLARLRAHVQAVARNRPGVYRMLGEGGEVVYVGKSRRLRTRLLSYFRADFPADKGARILREAASIEWTETPSEFAALLEELREIKRLRPRFNVAMKRDARHHCVIRLVDHHAPRLMVVRGAGSTLGDVYYGPFSGAEQVGAAVRELNDALGLRDCALDRRMYFSDQHELWKPPERSPGCIRLEIGKCLGPCVAASTRSAYMERVALARAFLDGADDGPMQRLEREMVEASEALAYERAAAVRDKLHRLESLREQFARLRFAVEDLSFVYPVSGLDGDDRLYVIRRGRVRGEIPSPRDDAGHAALDDMMRRVFSPGALERGTSIPAHEIDELLLLSSWFRQRPAELRRVRRPRNLSPAH